MMDENRKIALTAPVLPRVQPSEVISGDLYMVAVSDVSQSLGVADRSIRGGEVGVWVDDFQFAAGNMDAIWGPVPKFTLEGEGKVVE